MKQSRLQENEPNPMAMGFRFFAALLMEMAGLMLVVYGLSGVLGDGFYSDAPGYVFKPGTGAWGWSHIIAGCLAVAGAGSLFGGGQGGRLLAIAISLGIVVFSFVTLPAYPLWSVLIIAFNIGVLWSLVLHPESLE